MSSNLLGTFFFDILNVNFRLALILGGDFFTGSVLSTALTKLFLRFNEKTEDKVASNTLRAEVCSFSFVRPSRDSDDLDDSQCL